MAGHNSTCLIYINSEGISKEILNDFKTKILEGPDLDGMSAQFVHFKESSLSYRDLLAKARETKQLDAGCFFILNKDTANKAAVLCVETQVYTGLKGVTFRCPSAASSRRFYLPAKWASAMAVNLSIANMNWEEFSHDFGHAQLKHGEVARLP